MKREKLKETLGTPIKTPNHKLNHAHGRIPTCGNNQHDSCPKKRTTCYPNNSKLFLRKLIEKPATCEQKDKQKENSKAEARSNDNSQGGKTEMRGIKKLAKLTTISQVGRKKNSFIKNIEKKKTTNTCNRQDYLEKTKKKESLSNTKSKKLMGCCKK